MRVAGTSRIAYGSIRVTVCTRSMARSKDAIVPTSEAPADAKETRFGVVDAEQGAIDMAREVVRNHGWPRAHDREAPVEGCKLGDIQTLGGGDD